MFGRISAIALNSYRESVRARILLGMAGIAFAMAFYSLAIGAFTLVASIAIWLLLKGTIGIRVDEEEEVKGRASQVRGSSASGGGRLRPTGQTGQVDLAGRWTWRVDLAVE